MSKSVLWVEMEGRGDKGAHGVFWECAHVQYLYAVMTSYIMLDMRTYVKTYKMVHFKNVQFIVHQVYLNKAVQK